MIISRDKRRAYNGLSSLRLSRSVEREIDIFDYLLSSCFYLLHEIPFEIMQNFNKGQINNYRNCDSI